MGLNLLSKPQMLRPAIVTAGLAAVIIAALLAARAFGLLVPLELLAYDAAVRSRAGSDIDRRIVLVTRTDEDLRLFGHPTSDATLARLLETLASHKAAVIGVDIYRDVPVPPGKDRLDDFIGRSRNLVWVMKFAERDGHAVAPPAALANSDRQVGFNDLLDDPGGVIRRGLLVLDDGRTSAYSFALQLAIAFLEPGGKGLQPDAKAPEILRLGNTSIPAFERDDGGYVDADAGGYQFLLDFKGADARFPRYSVEEVLSGKASAAAFAGKIVIVGTDAKSIHDAFYTPLSAAREGDQRMPGAELHAHVASQLLRFAEGGARPLKVFGEGAEIAWIAAMGLLGATIGFAARTLGRYALAVLVAAAGIVAASYALFLFGAWLPVAAPLIGCLLSLTLGSGYASQHQRAQKAQIMRIFSQHVSKDIAEELWRERETFFERGRLRSQQITATVLFTDIRGFTPISERLGVTKLFSWLNEYMDSMSALVSRHCGIVKQYIGDGIMAMFGAPVAHADRVEIVRDAENAVRCALAMGSELERLNRRWETAGLPPISIRAGINSGSVMSGSLGGADHLEYTLIGDTVNTASRLESYGGNEDIVDSVCRVLISESTHKLVAGAFMTKYVGEVPLKGKAQKFRVYQVLGPAQNDSLADTPATAGSGKAA